ncbi:HNH endonuclease [Bosea thiooxidans]
MREAQLTAQPLCEYCLACDEVTEATVADHVKPHRGDEALFWDPDNLQSLCGSCHSRHKQAEEHGRTIVRFGADGWPE